MARRDGGTEASSFAFEHGIARGQVEQIAEEVLGRSVLVETAHEVRDRYLDSVTGFDRMRNFWKEMTGVYENDPPEPELFLTVW